MGPMPRHEWRGTELRFEMQPGVWGRYTDLQGPPGPAGTGGGGTVVVQQGGGGTGTAAGVPLFIASGASFTAPANQQTLFAVPLTCEGALEIDGVLEQVN